MKIPLIIFGLIVAVIGVMMFGSIGLSRLVRWLGWSQNLLGIAAMVCIFLAGICLAGWRFGSMEDSAAFRESLETNETERSEL